LAKLRRRLYERGFFKTHQVASPVISIGNLAVGGNRKTPLAAWLAEALTEKGLKPAILSRGYGRKRERLFKDPLVVSLGAGPVVRPEVAGDEPYLLAQRTSAMVVVARHRYLAAQLAESLGANMMILDDGFQRLDLHRDVDILALAGTKPFGNGLVLPAGPLRENLGAGGRADFCLIAEDTPPNPWNLPQFVANLKLTGLRPLGSDQYISSSEAQNLRLAAFCGLAKPWRFQKSLHNWGLVPVAFRAFPDHARYDQRIWAELTKFRQLAQAQWLLTTPKDAVKLTGLNLPILVVETKLRPLEPEKLLAHLYSLLARKGFKI
jgi:tetraacyldisaccharide 4'-kinase